MSELEPLEAYCAGLLSNLQPSSRIQLARQIANTLRRSNAQTIADQKNPDGTPFEPRKSQKLSAKKGRIRRKMFTKMRTNRLLKTHATSDSAVVQFASQVQRIAEVHHHGLRDKVNRRRSNLEVKYPERKLLGITQHGIDQVETLVINHLAR